MNHIIKLIFLLGVITMPTRGATPSPTSQNCACGVESSVVRFPWMASLVDRNRVSFCGGVLINPKEILTSARCVVGKSPLDIKLILGADDLRTASERNQFKIKEIISHNDYRKIVKNGTTTYGNDVALVIIDGKTSSLEYRSPICLSKSNHNELADEVTVLGWGQLSADEADMAQSLQILDRVSEPIDKCSATWKRAFTNEATICMGIPGHNICAGDYGGPLQVRDKDGRWELIGIASTSGPTCGDEYQGVYSKFEFYRTWLKSKSQGYSRCYQ